MHIGFRYHLASLVAVFFSLMLGILIGSALFQDDRLVQEQGYIISDLENRFRTLEQRTQTLQANLEFARKKEQLIWDGWGQMRHVLIEGRLEGSNIVMVDFDESKTSPWRQALEDAGAEIMGSLSSEELPAWSSPRDGELVAIFWVDRAPDAQLQHTVEQMAASNWSLAFVQSSSTQVSLGELAEIGLVVEVGDTPIGELAVIEGLAQGLHGLFGISDGSRGLLPVLDVEGVM